MKIKIVFKELSDSSDMIESMKILSVNSVGFDFKNIAEKELKNKLCPNCKEKTKGKIIIEPNLKNVVNITKSDFCCSEFKNSIDIPSGN